MNQIEMDVFVVGTDESHVLHQRTRDAVKAMSPATAATSAETLRASDESKVGAKVAKEESAGRLNVLVSSPLGGRPLAPTHVHAHAHAHAHAHSPSPAALGVVPGALVGPLMLQQRLTHRETPPRKRAYCMSIASAIPDDRETIQFTQNAMQQRPKIPRPPNAFMLFANEWRKKLAVQYPSESNKDISVRLGGMWKSLEKDSKEQYFALARQVDAEHKRKYPDYVYNPKEARLRKALREQSRENRSSLSRAHSAALLHHQQTHQQTHQQQREGAAGGPPGPPHAAGTTPPGMTWSRAPAPAATPASFGGLTAAARALRPPAPKVILDRSGEDMRSKIREQVEQGLVSSYPETMMEFEPITTYSMGQVGMPGAGEFSAVSDIDPHGWYSFAQASQHAGSSYVMRHTEDKLLSGNWNIHYTTDGHAPQGVPYLMRPQMVSSAGPFNNALNQSTLSSTTGHGINRGNSSQHPYQIYTPVSTASSQQIIKSKKQENEEQQSRILDNIPTSSANETTSSTVHQKVVMSNSNNSATTNTSSNKQTDSNSNKKPIVTPALSPSAIGAEKNETGDNTAENRPLPTFEQAFGSTEIGRYSHEGIFSGTQHNTQHQGPQNSDPKYVFGKSSGTYDVPPNSTVFDSPCDDYQHGFTPFILSSPSGKLESSDTLLPQSSWPSMFYYTPAAIPLPAAFFDYALLPGVPAATEFLQNGPDDTVLIDIPNAPGLYNRSDFQVACNGDRSSLYAAENAFKDCEEGVGYVTLHIPASTMQTVNAFSFPSESEKSTEVTKPETFLDKTDKQSPAALLESDTVNDESTMKNKVSGLDEGETQKENIKNEYHDENSDELKRQNLTITGMPMQEPIVISQNERICVIMDAPTTDTDYSGF